MDAPGSAGATGAPGASFRFSPRPNRAHLVRWRPWGEAAFAEAKRLDRPIALFITAFWCGFCQSLDETTLSDDEVITLLNGLFVPMRVEEGERPDVDARYNQAGAWPAIVLLTPGGVQLAEANYTPPGEFAALLVRALDYYQRNRQLLREAEAREPAAMRQDLPVEPAPLTSGLAAEVAGMLEGLADREFGGYGTELKMLHAEANDFFLHLYETTGERWFLDHVLLTLRRLRSSPTYDANDGGYFRYSSRRDWKEPHPEKLLSDQAGLLVNYVNAFRLSGAWEMRRAAEELIVYMDGALTAGDSPFFYGCQDYVRETDGGPRSVIDTHVYCDANAQAASAYLQAWRVLGDSRCRERATALADALWQRFRAPEGGMYHYWDGAAAVPGLLQDAVAAGTAFVDAYEATGTASNLERAHELAAYVLERHQAPEGGF
ncbi:MAG TPA: DUF255 domain-containing protein, partial [Dehalococcoidia bacterium]|nr:DUF255 domain-containing protein [Dehalococcoidia bacterium]